jgi:hypothetical protein
MLFFACKVHAGDFAGGKDEKEHFYSPLRKFKKIK